MTSPMDTAFAHRLLLAHLQAATSIATTFQNLPLFTPQPPQHAHHQPITTPPSSPRPTRRTPPPPQPQPSHSRSRSPPPTTGKPFKECKPEPSPSHTPTSPHQHSPHHHKPKATHHRLPQKNNTEPMPPHTPPITTISLTSSPNSPPQPVPTPQPVPSTKPAQILTESPPYPDNGGWEPSEDEKLAAFKLNKRARPSWKYIAKALNKTPFDCKGRWQVLRILYTPQQPDSPEVEPEASSPHKASHQAAASPPATKDASTMTYRTSGSIRQRDIEHRTAVHDQSKQSFPGLLGAEEHPELLMALYCILLSIRTYLHIGLLLLVVSAVVSNRLQPTTYHYSFLPQVQQKQDRLPAELMLFQHTPHTSNLRQLTHRQCCVQTIHVIPSNSSPQCIYEIYSGLLHLLLNLMIFLCSKFLSNLNVMTISVPP